MNAKLQNFFMKLVGIDIQAKGGKSTHKHCTQQCEKTLSLRRLLRYHTHRSVRITVAEKRDDGKMKLRVSESFSYMISAFPAQELLKTLADTGI